MQLVLTVNGMAHEVEARPTARLLDVLRDQLGLTGTKEGCAEGECGACTVIVDGRAVNSCVMLAVQARGKEILTVEGLAEDGELDLLQQKFVEYGAVQCGYCTPGHADVGQGAAHGQPGAVRAGHPHRAGRQPVPLHRLLRDRRRRQGGRAARRPRRRWCCRAKPRSSPPRSSTDPETLAARREVVEAAVAELTEGAPPARRPSRARRPAVPPGARGVRRPRGR